MITCIYCHKVINDFGKAILWGFDGDFCCDGYCYKMQENEMKMLY